VHATTSRAEPLCALWRPSALPALEAAFESGERAMHRAIGVVRSHPCAVDGAALVNVNEPSDLERR